ncbi:MAG: hypothetical protein ACLFUJ_16025 [Phycisphaerae bacterium]
MLKHMRSRLLLLIVAGLVALPPSMGADDPPEVGKLEPCKEKPAFRWLSGNSYQVLDRRNMQAKGLVHAQAEILKLGPVLIAVDADKADADQLNLVRVIRSVSQNPDFTDATVKPITQDRYARAFVEISPMRVVNKDITYLLHIGLYLRLSREQIYGYARTSFGFQAPCRFGDAVRQVRLVNSDLKPGLGDLVQVAATDKGLSGPVHEYYLDQPIRVGDSWYKLSADEKNMTLQARAMDLKSGTVQVASAPVGLDVQSSHGEMVCWLDETTGQLPAGRYNIDSAWLLGKPSGAEGKGPYARVIYGGKPFEIKADQSVKLQLGLPLQAGVSTSGRPSRGANLMRINLTLADAFNNRVVDVSLPNGSRPPAPKFRVLDAGGKVVHEGTLEYG